MHEDIKERINALILEIGGLNSFISENISQFNDKIKRIEFKDEYTYSKSEYWILIIFRDTFLKLKNILDQNFKYIETMGLLAVTRYVFETLVWSRLLDNDMRYGLVHYSHLIDAQIKHYEENLKKVSDEIGLFEALAKEENTRIDNAVQKIFEKGSNTLDPKSGQSQIIQEIMKETDRKARLSFCIYGDDAKVNGYGFQAYLLKKQMVEKIRNFAQEVREERIRFDKNCSGEILKLAQKRWKWNEQAKKVGMLEQYEFLYSFTSRLLHSTPVSRTTNQKDLELQEIKIFLDFTYIAILEISDLGKKQLSRFFPDPGSKNE